MILTKGLRLLRIQYRYPEVPDECPKHHPEKQVRWQRVGHHLLHASKLLGINLKEEANHKQTEYIHKYSKHETSRASKERTPYTTNQRADDCEEDLHIVLLIIGRVIPSSEHTIEESSKWVKVHVCAPAFGRRVQSTTL